MRNQNKIYTILKVLLEIMAGVIIGIGVYSCKKEEPIREDTSSIEAVGQEPSKEHLCKETKITFASNPDKDLNYEIYIMNPDGSDRTRLTGDYADLSSPDYAPQLLFSWSPDGRKIIFVSLRDNHSEIFLVNSDGSEKKNLTNNPADDGYPSWSPEGQKIAFHSDREGGVQVYVLDIDGNEPRRLTYDSENAGPCWSPDGERIVYMSSRDGNLDIYVMNADGSEQKRLTDDSMYTGCPLWSPDGKKIAFRARGADAGRFDLNEIHVMNVDGSEELKIAEGLPHPYPNDYCWSPDGSKIVFTADKDGNLEIYTVSVDGSSLVNLTNNPANDGTPSWSPDGSKIAFTSDRDGNSEIYIMNADGSEQKRLTNNPDRDVCPCWSPFLTTENTSSDDNLYSQSQETAFEGEEERTADGIPIIMDTEIIWRIAKSQQSFSADNTFEEVEGQLVSRIRNTNNYVIGTHYFYDFINGEQPEIKFGRIQYENVDEMQTTLKQAVTKAGFIKSETSEIKVNRIQDEMLTRLQQYVSDDGLGIEIEQVVIKQIRFSEAVRKSL